MPKTSYDATYRRDRPIGFLPAGITDPHGDAVGSKGKFLTYKDLTGPDGAVDLAKMQAFKQYITLPENEATWITPQTMGAPFDGSDAQAMLTEYATRKGLDPQTCLKEMVLSRYATDLYNQGLRDARPLKSGKPKVDHTRMRLVNAVKARHPGWANMSVEDRTRIVVEYLSEK